VISAEKEGTFFKVWNAQTGKEFKTISGATKDVPVMTVTPDGKKLMAWGARPLIETYDLTEGKLLASFPGFDKEGTITSLAFSLDGEVAALGGSDGVVRLWDVVKKERLPGGDMPAHKLDIVDLTITPDKKTLVTSDKTGEVKIWDLANRAAALHTITLKNPITGFAMSPDGSRFATTGQDNVVKVFNVKTGKELRSWDLHIPQVPNRPFVGNLAFTADGKQLATVNANTTAYLLDCED
jgi:WD40 repeat protein